MFPLHISQCLAVLGGVGELHGGCGCVCVSECMALTSAALADAGCTSVVIGFRADKCFFSKALAAHPFSAVVF